MNPPAEPLFQRWGWGVSFALHLGVLVLGGLFIVQSPQFGVAVAPTSTEVDLVESPPPQPPKPAPVSPDVTPPPQPDDMLVKKTDAPPVAQPPPAPPDEKKSPLLKQHIQSAAVRGSQSASPDYLRNPPPVYPAESQEAHEQGIVLVRVEVGVSGNVEAVSLQQSSGHFRLDRAALEAVRHWKFHPATLAGVAIEADVAVPVHFELN